jgi:hypothetical protein
VPLAGDSFRGVFLENAMPRKKPAFRVRTVYVPDPDPEGKRRIREDLTGRLRPALSRPEVRARFDELLRLRASRKLSVRAYKEQDDVLYTEARRDPNRFWDELGDAFDTYWWRARKRTSYRAVTGRLRYVEKALAAWPPRRLKSSRMNLAKTIDQSGLLPHEHEEFVTPPRVVAARIIAERTTVDQITFRAYLMEEKARLEGYREALESQAGPYLGKTIHHGKRSSLALREFILAVRKLLKYYLTGPFRWADVTDVCRYFHPPRLKPPTKIEPNDPHESLDDAFWFPTKDTLRRLILRP